MYIPFKLHVHAAFSTNRYNHSATRSSKRRKVMRRASVPCAASGTKGMPVLKVNNVVCRRTACYKMFIRVARVRILCYL